MQKFLFKKFKFRRLVARLFLQVFVQRVLFYVMLCAGSWLFLELEMEWQLHTHTHMLTYENIRTHTNPGLSALTLRQWAKRVLFYERDYQCYCYDWNLMASTASGWNWSGREKDGDGDDDGDGAGDALVELAMWRMCEESAREWERVEICRVHAPRSAVAVYDADAVKRWWCLLPPSSSPVTAQLVICHGLVAD